MNSMKKKTVMVLGLGAQGFAAARCFDKEPYVEKIICADADHNALKQVKKLKKGEPVLVDARDKDSIVSAARGVFLLVNALPLSFTPNVMNAALEVGAHYQDYAASTAFAKEWVDSIHYQFDVYGPEIRKSRAAGTYRNRLRPGTHLCGNTGCHALSGYMRKHTQSGLGRDEKRKDSNPSGGRRR